MLQEAEQAEFAALNAQLEGLLAHWDERSATQVASLLQTSSLELILALLAQHEHQGSSALFLYGAVAKLLLARYVHEAADLEHYRAELWAIARQSDPRHGVLREVLQAILDIARQQPAHHPSLQIYRALGLMAEEVLQSLGEVQSAFPQRARRRRLNVSLAHTAELPELSALTLEPVESPFSHKTGLLSGLPPSIVLPTRYVQREWIVDWLALEIPAEASDCFLKYLPQLYGILESWDDEHSPFELAEALEGLGPERALELSAALLPHPAQVEYLRALALWLHLQWLQVDLTEINETMRAFVSGSSSRAQVLLPALTFFLYCSSYSFAGIQEQALKRLESKQGYLYHLILQEWAKNKRIRSFVRTRLPRQEQLAVKLLQPSDWTVIFFILNRGWARSVMRDVYGLFHGDSAFVNQIVDADTSRGFGDLTASRGVNFLATSQISDLLRQQARQQPDAQTRLHHFETFVDERFRKEILRREQRPSLNASSLTRLARLISSWLSRAEQEGIADDVACRIGSRAILKAYTYLSQERLAWLGYEMTRLWLNDLDYGEALALRVRGLVQALLEEMEYAFSHRLEASDVLAAVLHSMLDALLDHAVVQGLSAQHIRELPGLLLRELEEQTPLVFQPLYRHYFLTQALPE